jgi:hypothetical protein
MEMDMATMVKGMPTNGQATVTNAKLICELEVRRVRTRLEIDCDC